jgi:serine protease Do
MKSSRKKFLVKLHEVEQDYVKRRREKYAAFLKSFFIIILIAAAFTIGYSINPKAYRARDPNLVSDIAEEIMPSIVVIESQNNSGSGIVISENGLIITNNHVISEISNITKVMTSDKIIYPVTLIGKDIASDLAVIKIDAKNLIPAKFGDSDKTKIGEEVIAIGNPFGLDSTITTGIISAKNRNRGSTIYRDFLQTDANINPGNSGGPLVNLNGEVIGINTFIISSQVSQGAGFAIPSNLIKKVAESLIRDGKVSRGYMGVQVTNIVDFDEDGIGMIGEGARISGLEPDGPSRKAGLELNDTVTFINDIKIEDSNQLKNVVAWIPPGETARVTIIRNGETRQFKVILDERPEDLR